ncbi:MAG: hypothetical protein D6753_18215, partial [Planctomycetota bacterium]
MSHVLAAPYGTWFGDNRRVLRIDTLCRSIAMVAAIAMSGPAAQGQSTASDAGAQTASEPTIAQDAGAAKAADSPQPDAPMGLDEWIDAKFKPVADWWEAVVLTPIPLGTQIPPVEELLKPEVQARIGLDPPRAANIAMLIEDRDLAVSAEPNGHRRAEIVQAKNQEILAMLTADQLEKFRRPRQVPLVLILLVCGAAFFTLAFGFVNV